MATLRIVPKSTDSKKSSKAPARRADPSKRDLSQPFVKPQKPENPNQKMDSRFRENDGQKNISAVA